MFIDNIERAEVETKFNLLNLFNNYTDSIQETLELITELYWECFYKGFDKLLPCIQLLTSATNVDWK